MPDEIAADARLGVLADMLTQPVLERLDEACADSLLLLKGPEIARRYPARGLRPYRDLDLLALDPSRVQSALLAAGWERLRDEPLRRSLQHDDPLLYPGLALPVEVHRRPKWISWGAPPSTDDLFALATPAPWRPEGRLLVLPPDEHAVLVAVHAWAHQPLRRLLDFVDVAALASEGDRDAQQRCADRWNVGPLWRTTVAAGEALLDGAPLPWPLRTWARDLLAVRGRTRTEAALERWLSPLAGRGVRRGLGPAARAVAADAMPGAARAVRRRRQGVRMR